MRHSKTSQEKQSHRILKVIFTVIVFALLALYVLMPATVGIFALMRHPSEVGAPPDGFQSVRIPAADGEVLAAWNHHGQNGAVILVLHGATASREEIRPIASALAASGFGVLAPDLRGHGESGGRGVPAYGWRGTEDVRACLEWIKKQESPTGIGGYGSSLGGEILLGASSDSPAMETVVADGATYRSLSDYLILPSHRSLWHSFTTRVLFATIACFGREDEPKRLVDAMTGATDTSFLLIEAGNVDQEAEYGDMLAESAQGRAQQWQIPGVSHVGGHQAMPEEYEKRIIGFFREHLHVPAP